MLKQNDALMKTILFLLLTLALAGTAMRNVAQSANSPRESSTCAEGELLVKWRGGPLGAPAAHGNARCGGEVKRNFREIGWQWVKLPPGMTVSRGMELYRGEPDVLAVEPNVAAEFTAVPNDPMFGSQWNLQKISAPAAWDITKGSNNVVVAVLDSGIEYTHPDLSANMWRNPGETGLDFNGNDKATNGIDDDGNGYVDDVHGIDAFDHDSDPMDFGWMRNDFDGYSFHGTAVAGVIGAVGNNGQGMAGVSWNVKLMALRRNGGDVADSTARLYLTRALEGYEYVIAMKRRGVNVCAVNNSWGFYDYNQAQADAFDVAGREGILSICAAGNSAYNSDNYAHWPSCYDFPYVISVAASNPSDTLASFSSFGRGTVDLAAPGEGILTTWRTNDYNADWGGTSAAAPHVSGAVALLAAAYPTASWWEIKAALLQSVDQLPAFRDKVASHGRLNLARALQVVTNSALPPVIIGAFPASSRTRANVPIEVVFNQPMNRASVEAALVVSPQVSGVFDWQDDDRVCRLIPNAPYASTNYTVRVLGTAMSVSGRTLDGDFSRFSQGSPADDYIWGFQFPLTNDDFANAQSITSTNGLLAATTRNASHEVDEPYHAGSRLSVASVWYRWTALSDGWVTFAISSNSFDTFLAAYSGASLDSLALVAANDNDALASRSRIWFLAIAGTSYSIAVAGKSGNTSRNNLTDSSMGPFTLTWSPTPSASLSGFSPSSGYIGTTVTLNGTNFTGATGVLFNGVSAVFTNAPTNNADFVITAIVPPGATTGPITVVTPHGNSSRTNEFTLLIAPALGLRALPGNQVELSWLVTGAAGFIPEAADTVPSAIWTRVTAPVVTTNGIRSMKLPASSTSKFYRMRKP